MGFCGSGKVSICGNLPKLMIAKQVAVSIWVFSWSGPHIIWLPQPFNLGQQGPTTMKAALSNQQVVHPLTGWQGSLYATSVLILRVTNKPMLRINWHLFLSSWETMAPGLWWPQKPMTEFHHSESCSRPPAFINNNDRAVTLCQMAHKYSVIEEAMGGSLLHTAVPSSWSLANSVIHGRWHIDAIYSGGGQACVPCILILCEIEQGSVLIHGTLCESITWWSA